MKIDPDTFYNTDDEALRFIASKQTMARWRSEGKGPNYVKFGSRVAYKGSDLLDWIKTRTVVSWLKEPLR